MFTVPGHTGHTVVAPVVASVVLTFTVAHGHTDHTDEPHNHPNAPTHPHDSATTEYCNRRLLNDLAHGETTQSRNEKL